MVYSHQQIEKKWMKKWEEEGLYETKDRARGRKNFYHLVMFPYPSGDLHIGHWYNYAPADVYARLKKMQGFNVLSPIGFDAFGLPAENAAIKRRIHPKDWTYKNIRAMTKQLKSIGAIYDWSRKVVTSDPDYYKWTEWMFIQFFKNGLAYRKKAPANWCPSCHTVLANEQVIEGECERCGTEVVQREIEQWLFKITDYAERLLKDLDKVDWPDKTKIMQRNWIGRSEGSIIKFEIRNSRPTSHGRSPGGRAKFEIPVFTTRADTLFGATYMVLAPEHQLIKNLESRIKNLEEVKRYIKKAQRKTDLERTELAKDKTGVELKGVKAINPATKKEIPIWIADYVLAHYGTGAIMGVPAHDQRDFEFAKRFKLPIKMVIYLNYPAPKCPILDVAYEDDGYLVDSGKFNGIFSTKAKAAVTKFVGGKRQIQYHLRDWLVSRQRYWGAPIPLVFCNACKIRVESSKLQAPNSKFSKGELLNPGWVAVPEKNLPVILPKVKKYLPTEEGKSPLAHSEKFVNVKCPKCGSPAKRETDTMDTFVCSSWYYLRYVDPQNSKEFADPEKMKKWLPVDIYIGGAEHSVMHLLYSRFFTKALYDFGYISFEEPFSKLRHQGTVLGPDGQKMSKSRGNIIDPDDMVKKFGSDAVRMYLCFMGPYDRGGPWNPTGILGVVRFLNEIRNYFDRWQNEKGRRGGVRSREHQIFIKRRLHRAIKKVTEDIEELRYNTAIAELMTLRNELDEYLSGEDVEALLKLLAPFAPFTTEEIWHTVLGKNKSIHIELWPAYDPRLIKEKEFELVIQVNGKVRDKVLASIDIREKEASDRALSREKIKQLIGSQKVQKIIFVPNRLINIVIAQN